MSKTRTFSLLLATLVSAGVAVADQVPMGGYSYDRRVAAPTGHEWNSPTLVALNKERPHAYFFSFGNAQEALHVLPEASTFWKSLNGEWAFHWVGTPDQRPVDFYKTNYDISGWDKVQVPMNWNIVGIQKDGTQKYGTPIYTNQRVIFQHQVKVDDWKGGVMREPRKDWPTYVHRNEVGSYRRNFTIPADWDGREVYINFDGVDSFFYLYINGKYVGFSKNSRNLASFNITPYLVKGENVVAAEVYRNSDGSFLESQDMFRLPGIFRTVSLTAKPKVQVRDLQAIPDFDAQWINASLRVKASVANLSNKTAKGLTISYTLYEKQLYGEAVRNTPIGGTTAPLDVKKQSESDVELTIQAGALVKKWSAEAPHRYVLVGELKDKKGQVLETFSTTVGFRKIEIKQTAAQDDEFGLAGRYYYLNGKPIKMKGVNRHETSPEHGHAITRQQMEKEVMLMKRGNINHVRNSHYPTDPYFYYLADKYGLYLEDEANIESHQYHYGKESLSHVPEFLDQHLDRNLSMVHATINHPSVCIWSLGNEAGPGENFVKAYQAIKSVDTSRPVQYERNNDIVDMGSNQYPSIRDVRRHVTGQVSWMKYPFHISEYAHSMGNACGNLVDYWDAIESTNFLMGGAIWDWVDQAMYNYTPSGIRYWGYGGDFGDKPNDGMFCMNGVMRPDLSPKGQYYEVKKVYQNVGVKAIDAAKGQIEIFNKNYFTSLADYDIRWTLYADGLPVKELTAQPIPNAALPINARERKQLQLDYRGYQLDPAKEYFLKVQFLQKTDKPWAKAGYVQMEEQLPVQAAQHAVSIAQVQPKNTRLTLLVTKGGNIEVKGKDFAVSFDGQTGVMSSLVYAGQTIILPEQGPRIDAFRARVDNDNWFDHRWPQYGLHNLKHRVLSATQEVGKDGHVRLMFTIESQAPYAGKDSYSNRDREKNEYYKIVDDTSRPLGKDDFKLTTSQIYTIYPDGSIELQSAITSNKSNVVLPRLGYVMQLPTSFKHYNYYGRGPVNNYNDRKTGQFIEQHQGIVGEQDIMLPKPQSMGNREDLRWCALTDDSGRGVAFVADGTMSASVLPWSALELMEAGHPHELPTPSATHLHLDAKVTGLGGNSCGQGGPLEHDRVYAKSYNFGFIMRPVQLSNLQQTVKVSTAGEMPLGIDRDKDGLVSITAAKGHRVVYSIDGGKPQLYTAPFDLFRGGVVKAWYAHAPKVTNTLSFERMYRALKVVGCSSQEHGEGAVENIVDRNPSTIWHSMYSVTVAKYPYEIDFDATETKLMQGFVYTGRQDGENGRIKDYEIYVSQDGKTWGQPVLRGQFLNNGTAQKVMLPTPIRARYVRFRPISSHAGHDFASAAEFSLIAD